MTAEDNSQEPASSPEAAAAETRDAGAAEADAYFNLIRQKTDSFVFSGLREGHARGLAMLEARIANWPSGWGDDLVVLIFGDFRAPPEALDFPHLGITIEPDKIDNSIVRSALCVLKARVKIAEKSVNALIDAAGRLNTLLGVFAVLNWGNAGSGWWSYVTHGSAGGVMSAIEPDRIQKVLEALGKLPAAATRHVRSALYWIREPRQLLMEAHRSDVLRLYAGYWNAFECLVEAVCILRPQSKLRSDEKQAAINAFVEKRNGKLDAAAITQCYQTFVNPGFIAKASHALNVCFPKLGATYVNECFKMKPAEDRLYNIRNAINHGDIDTDNPSELLRVEDRHLRLWMIVFGMLGLLIPIDRPLDHPETFH